MNRIYGKLGALLAQVPPDPVVDVIRSISLDEKLELLRRLQRSEFADTGSAVPIVEAAPRSG
jgi:hypothetical protein